MKDLMNPSVFDINKEAPHTLLIPEESVKIDLNGLWNFFGLILVIVNQIRSLIRTLMIQNGMKSLSLQTGNLTVTAHQSM